jgi:branched-chain amino acid transport system permease protein
VNPFTVIALAVPGLAAAASFVVPSYWLTLLIYVGISSLVCLGLAAMTGYAGITSFGQAAFVGVGAYATALLTTHAHVSPWLGLLASVACTLSAAVAIGWITVRLSGHFLVLGTFAWSIGLYHVFANVEALGGYNGLSGLPPLFLPEGVDERVLFNLLVWITVAVALALTINVLDSRIGRAIRSVRFPVLAESFGIDTARCKLAVFVLAAAFAGVAGWMHAHFLRFVNPNPFHLNASVEYLFMTIIGGIANLLGAIAGAFFVTVAKSWLQGVFSGSILANGNYEIVAFGVLVLLLLHLAPPGIMMFMPEKLRLASRSRRAPVGDLFLRPKPAPGSTVLWIQRVSKSFGGLRVLDDVTFPVSAAEVVALVGPNGAGKSTLFDIVSGLVPLSSGAVWLSDERIDALGARRIAERGMARTFQHTHLQADMTVLENVAIGAHVRTRGGMLRAALRLDREEEARILAEARAKVEDVGLLAALDKPAGSLSLGQQRIAEVARALTADPILILLDEPAAGLRQEEKERLASLIRTMRSRGVAVLVVEHDLEFVAQVADRVVVLDFGTKIAEGAPTDVVRDRRVVEAYLGSPDEDHEHTPVCS